MGIFNVFFDLLAQVMAFFYSLVPSYGFTIIALTLLVMVILTPLTLKGTRSMMMMQQLQPEMKKLQTQYKDDRQKLNEELMKFYKENNINPVGGCLPLLVQMPVFIVLYNVLRGLTQRVPVFDVGWISGQIGSGAAPATPPPAAFEPAYLHQDSAMYQSLSQTSVMDFAGMDLAASCSEALRQGIGHAAPYIALIIIVGATGFIQQKQIQGRMSGDQVNPQQQMIMKIMPIFLPVISFGLPAGLVLYFAVSNLYRIGQQWFISRSIYGIKRGEKPATATGGKGGTGKAGGGRTVEPKGPKGGGSAGAKKKAIEGKATDAPTTKSKDDGDGKGSGKRLAASGASSNSGARSGSAKGSAKAPAKAPAKGSRSDASNSGADRATSGKGGAGTGPTPPTLQPRARKNKKR
jgi:YidC/Oxa1 family membrane protein insertase